MGMQTIVNAGEGNGEDFISKAPDQNFFIQSFLLANLQVPL